MELAGTANVAQLGYQNPVLKDTSQYMLWGTYYALDGIAWFGELDRNLWELINT